MFLINFFFKSLSQKTENFLNQITKTETNQNTEKDFFLRKNIKI